MSTGYLCNLVISFAAAVGSPTTKETYNINENVAKPDQVCRGAARVAAASGPVGTKAEFELTKDDITVDGKSGSQLRLEDKPADPNKPNEKLSIQLRGTLNNGGYADSTFTPEAVEVMRNNLKKDTTLGMRP